MKSKDLPRWIVDPEDPRIRAFIDRIEREESARGAQVVTGPGYVAVIEPDARGFEWSDDSSEPEPSNWNSIRNAEPRQPGIVLVTR